MVTNPIQSPLPNQPIVLPEDMKMYDVNGDGKINPAEITPDALEAIMDLDDEQSQTLFLNSTNTVPAIIEQLHKIECERTERIITLFEEFETQRKKLFDEQANRYENLLNDLKYLIQEDNDGRTYKGLDVIQRPKMVFVSSNIAYDPDTSYLDENAYKKIVGQVAVDLRERIPRNIAYFFGLDESIVQNVIARTYVVFYDRTTDNTVHYLKDPRTCTTSIMKSGESFITMDNYFMAHCESHRTTIVHEATHAVFHQIIGTGYPDWIIEGLAVFVAGETNRQVATDYCDGNKLSDCNPKTSPLLELIESKQTCEAATSENTSICYSAEDNTALENFPYSLGGAAFSWLGRRGVLSFTQALHQGESIDEAIRMAVSDRLGQEISDPKKAHRLLIMHAFEEIRKIIDSSKKK